MLLLSAQPPHKHQLEYHLILVIATPPAHAEQLAAAIAGARLEMLDAAHLSNIEQPAGFNGAVLRFLEA